MESKEEVSEIGFEMFVFKSTVSSTGDRWWEENPVATVKITKIANWVTLWFEELVYKEVLPWHFIERYTNRRSERLIFEKKLPERFRPRKKIHCEVLYYGYCGRNSGWEEGLDVLPDGTIQTNARTGRYNFELPTPESAAGWGSGECAYATDEKHGVLEQKLKQMREVLELRQKMVQQMLEIERQLAEHSKKIAEFEEHQKQLIDPETCRAASLKKGEDAEPGS
jgi:hypothetical protein